MSETFVSLLEATRRTGVSYQTIRAWVAEGRIQWLNRGSALIPVWHVNPADVAALAAAQEPPRESPRRPAGVYAIRDTNRPAVKIGVTDEVGRRLKTLRHASGLDLALAAWIPTQDRAAAFTLEAVLHTRFAAARTPGTEWFALTPEIEAWLEEVHG